MKVWAAILLLGISAVVSLLFFGSFGTPTGTDLLFVASVETVPGFSAQD